MYSHASCSGSIARSGAPAARAASSLRPLSFEQVPDDLGLLPTEDRLRRPSPGGLGFAAERRQQRAAAFVARLYEQLAVGGRVPCFEQPLGTVAVAGAQLDLAQVQPQHHVGKRLSTVVGGRQQLADARTSGHDVAPPEQLHRRDAVGRPVEIDGRVLRVAVAVDQLRERPTAQRPRPSQRRARMPLRFGTGMARSGQRLGRARFRVGDPLHARHREHLRSQCERLREQLGFPAGGGHGQVEVALEVVDVLHGSAIGEQQLRPYARRTGRQGVHLRHEQIGHALWLACDHEVLGERQQPLHSLRAGRRRRQSQRVLSQRGGVHDGAARGGDGRGSRDGRRDRLVGQLGGQRQMMGATLATARDPRQLQQHLPPLIGAGMAPHRNGQQRMRRP